MAIDFYAAGLLSVPTGFKRIQGPGTTVGYSYQRAVGHDEYGDEQESDLHSVEFAFEEVFESTSDTMTIPPDIGVLDGTVTIVSLRVETGLQRLRLTIGGVYYTDSDTAPTRKYTHGVTLSQGFGAVDFMAATAGTAHVLSGNLTISCEVVPGFDGSGDYVQHEIHGGKMVAESSWMGKPTTDAAAAWDVTSAKPDRSNTDFYKWDVSGEQGMASAAVGA